VIAKVTFLIMQKCQEAGEDAITLITAQEYREQLSIVRPNPLFSEKALTKLINNLASVEIFLRGIE
jgi:hypothetical protein